MVQPILVFREATGPATLAEDLCLICAEEENPLVGQRVVGHAPLNDPNGLIHAMHKDCCDAYRKGGNALLPDGRLKCPMRCNVPVPPPNGLLPGLGVLLAPQQQGDNHVSFSRDIIGAVVTTAGIICAFAQPLLTPLVFQLCSTATYSNELRIYYPALSSPQRIERIGRVALSALCAVAMFYQAALFVAAANITMVLFSTIESWFTRGLDQGTAASIVTLGITIAVNSFPTHFVLASLCQSARAVVAFMNRCMMPIGVCIIASRCLSRTPVGNAPKTALSVLAGLSTYIALRTKGITSLYNQAFANNPSALLSPFLATN
jgi:hypothetical protein